MPLVQDNGTVLRILSSFCWKTNVCALYVYEHTLIIWQIKCGMEQMAGQEKLPISSGKCMIVGGM